ncbi:DMT family transporter [Acuticoccus sp. I52.16.1]|uniref:DMT family transporter n=1 Tax=Acuticoccus sp. I52.16.1 TaxID=2928472 RepID=UPI001FD2B6F9|nr:DMT family transporter [Acuticoccus sp. I52.16.1]UOM35471.1 DMT family transporter [Acuticoccus sp. I52.16.1]
MTNAATNTLRARPIGMLIAGALLYGLFFPFNKMAAEAGAPFFSHAFWQSFGAGVALWVVAAARGTPVHVSWPYLRAYVMIGGSGIGLPMALLTFVAPHLPAGPLSLVMALSPTFTYLLAVMVGIDRFVALGLVGILVGLAGVAVIVVPDAALPSPEAAGWFMLALAAPVMFAVANVSAAVLRPPATTSVVLGCGTMLGSAAVVLVCAVATGQLMLPTEPMQLIPAVATAAINATFIVLFAEIVRLYGPTFFAQFNYLAVIAALFWGFVFFGERPNGFVAVALLLMVVGVVLTELRHRLTPKP